MICFDLDDTLYKEIDYLKSAYMEIAKYAIAQCAGCSNSAIKAYNRMLEAYYASENAFEALNSFLGLNRTVNVSDYLYIYRNHKPKIALPEDTVRALDTLKKQGVQMGLITDGRSVQQRNKIEALGLDRWIENKDIVISEEFGSEKPCIANYIHFMKRYPVCQCFTYVGDNLLKDFIAPNQLEWNTVCLKDDGRNIHGQKMKGLTGERMPKMWIDELVEISYY